MLSWRLWQTLTEPSVKNPIFAFVRDKKEVAAVTQPRSKWIHLGIRFLIVLILLIAFLRVPEFVLVLFQIPLFLIVMVIVSPLFLPVVFVLFGGILVNKISRAIHQEKYQFTYELLCASPDGSLYANWSFAKGLLHRHGVFVWLKAMTQIFFKIGSYAIGLSGIIIVVSIISHDQTVGLEQLKLLINPIIILGLFYTTMHHSVVLSIIIGLYASNLDFNRHDSSMIAMLTYIFAQSFPFLIAFGLYYVTTTSVNLPHPMLNIIIDGMILMSIYFSREFMISILWFRLKYLLNATSDTTQIVQSESPPYISIFSAN